MILIPQGRDDSYAEKPTSDDGIQLIQSRLYAIAGLTLNFFFSYIQRSPKRVLINISSAFSRAFDPFEKIFLESLHPLSKLQGIRKWCWINGQIEKTLE